MAGTTTKLLETKKLSLELETGAPQAVLRPAGIVDEEADFTVVLKALQTLPSRPIGIRLDLSQVSRINSQGVRSWLIFLDELQKQFPVSFFQVSDVMVEQANMILGVLGKKPVRVASFYAPYRCVSCFKDYSILLEVSQIQLSGGAPQFPRPPCQNCGKPLDLDSPAELYFTFLQ